MTFDQWIYQVSKGIQPQGDESQEGLSNMSQLSDEYYEEEESSNS